MDNKFDRRLARLAAKRRRQVARNIIAFCLIVWGFIFVLSGVEALGDPKMQNGGWIALTGLVSASLGAWFLNLTHESDAD